MGGGVGRSALATIRPPDLVGARGCVRINVMRYVLRRGIAFAAVWLAGCASRVGAPIAEPQAASDASASTASTASPQADPAWAARRDASSPEVRGRHGELVLVEASDPTLAPGSAALNLDASHPTDVWLGERKLGTTPLEGVRLPVGTHVLALINPATNARELHAVTLHDREVVTRRHACSGTAESEAPTATPREALARRVAP